MNDPSYGNYALFVLDENEQTTNVSNTIKNQEAELVLEEHSRSTGNLNSLASFVSGKQYNAQTAINPQIKSSWYAPTTIVFKSG